MLEIKSVSNMENMGLSAIVYSVAGMGKTSLAKKFKNVLIIDLEGGVSVLKEDKMDKDIPYISINKNIFIGKNSKGAKTVQITALKEIIQEVTESKYETIIFDSATMLESILLTCFADLNKLTGTPTLQNYGQLIMMLNSIFLDLRNLRNAGKNVIVTCLEKNFTIQQDDMSTVTQVMPLINASKGALIQKLVGDFDIVARMKKGKEENYLQVQPLEGEFAKSRIHKTKPAVLGQDLFKRN